MYHPIFSDFSLQLYKPGNILHLAEGSCEKGSSHQEENDRMCPRNGPHARRISVCACLPSISSSNTSLRTTQRKRGATFRLDIYSKKWIVGFFQPPGTAGGPGGRDRMYISSSYMSKYWGGNYFAHGSFPKWVKSKKRRKKR